MSKVYLFEATTKEQLKKVTDYIVDTLPCATSFYIAGGAIRDLLVGDTPHDYDIFFRNHRAAKRFQEHYIDYFKSEDMTLCCITENAITIQIKSLDNIKLQFIVKEKYCKDPTVTVNRFDFTHSMAYFQFNHLETSAKMLDAVRQHQLVYNSSCHTPVNSIFRMFKFLGRGWKISVKQFLAVIILGLLDFKNYSEVKTKYKTGY